MKQDPKTSTPKSNVWALYRTAGERYHENIEPIPNVRSRDDTLANISLNSSSNVDYLLKYQECQRDNNILLLSLRDREREIEKLKSIIKSLQSESESSDSRQEKSVSTNSSLPVVRVTPQKRVKNTSQSPRRASRRLFPANNYESPERSTLSYPRQILRNAGIDSDILLSSSTNSTPRNRDANRNHIVSNDMVTISSTPTIQSRSHLTSVTPARASGLISGSASDNIRNRSNVISVASPLQPALPRSHNSNSTFVIESLGRPQGHIENRPPSYYLNRNRPEFIRRSELRQSIIQEASRRREEIEKKRKDAVRALAMGSANLDEVSDLIFADPTTIQAFPKKDMKAITRRKFCNTHEYKNKVMERERKIEQATNRILKTCFSLKTRNNLLS